MRLGPSPCEPRIRPPKQVRRCYGLAAALRSEGPTPRDTMTDGSATMQAGWYQDPTIAGQLRYWSGTEWTQEVQPAPPAPGQFVRPWWQQMVGHHPHPPGVLPPWSHRGMAAQGHAGRREDHDLSDCPVALQRSPCGPLAVVVLCACEHHGQRHVSAFASGRLRSWIGPRRRC